MKLIPDDALQGLQRGLVAAIWGIGTLLLGTLVMVSIELLFEVSGHTSLGIGGGMVVVVVACAVALIVWRRHGRDRRGHKRHGVSDWPERERAVVRPPAKPAKMGTRIPPPAEKPEPHTPAARAPHGVTEAKQRFHAALEAGHFATAEQIVSEIETFPDESQWCANARRRIHFARTRRS